MKTRVVFDGSRTGRQYIIESYDEGYGWRFQRSFWTEQEAGAAAIEMALGKTILHEFSGLPPPQSSVNDA